MNESKVKHYKEKTIKNLVARGYLYESRIGEYRSLDRLNNILVKIRK